MQDAVTYVSIHMNMTIKQVLAMDHISFGKLYKSCERVKAKEKLERLMEMQTAMATCSMGANDDTFNAFKDQITDLQIAMGLFSEEPEEQVTPASQIPCGM